MSTRAEFALPGLAGALVVVAVLFTVWLARDSSADSEALPASRERPPQGLYSARSHRIPVTRTAIPRAQLPTNEVDSSDEIETR